MEKQEKTFFPEYRDQRREFSQKMKIKRDGKKLEKKVRGKSLDPLIFIHEYLGDLLERKVP